jgi:4-hydroxybenzoate polyprenyltransferase
MTHIMSKISIFLEMIKFEHTIFALPFAYMGAFLAAHGEPTLRQAFWILMGMVGGRTAAMGFNRIVDIRYDLQNPRTRDRALPRGLIARTEAWGLVLMAIALYFLSAFMLNRLALMVSPLFLAVLLAYSYTKRFTALCHIFLGMALGLSPIAGWIAVRGDIQLLPVVLGCGVLCWVAGFDILYACMDADFDKDTGLYSIPACFGLQNAFRISAGLHLAAFLAFLGVGILGHLNWIYYTGLALTGLLLLAQRRVVAPNDLSRLNLAFFTFNGAISIVLFIFTAISLLY